MIISIDEVMELCDRNPPLIESVTKEQFDEAHVGIDLRLGSIYNLPPKSRVLLGAGNRRNTTEAVPIEIMNYKSQKIGTPFVMKPNMFILVETLEKLNLGHDIVAITFPRTTLHTSGVFISTCVDHPKYSGNLIFGMSNNGPCNFTIELGARFIHILFFRVFGKTIDYGSGDKAINIKKGITEFIE